MFHKVALVSGHHLAKALAVLAVAHHMPDRFGRIGLEHLGESKGRQLRQLLSVPVPWPASKPLLAGGACRPRLAVTSAVKCGDMWPHAHFIVCVGVWASQGIGRNLFVHTNQQ
jgi:hypothetical protein